MLGRDNDFRAYAVVVFPVVLVALEVMRVRAGVEPYLRWVSTM